MSYDTLAPFYERLETWVFRGALQRARCEVLASWEGPGPREVLLLGEGDGRFLRAAVARWPEARFVVIDFSVGMRRQALRRVELPAVEWIAADVREGLVGRAAASADLVVSHFFLDCFSEATLRAWEPEVRRCLRPRGTWWISEFAADTRWQRLFLWVMYRCFRVATETEASAFPNYANLLDAEGWKREPRNAWWRGFIVAERWKAPLGGG